MFSAIMTDPFAMSYPGTLSATIKALEATMTSCWPRILNSPWQEEITKILVVCWLNVHESNNNSGDIDAELVKAAGMLSAVMKAGDIDVAAKMRPLVVKEPRLKKLFGNTVSG